MGWDLFDAIGYSVFGIFAFALALALNAYSTPGLAGVGLSTAACGWVVARRMFGDTFNIAGPR
jgi:hypothetical protein